MERRLGINHIHHQAPALNFPILVNLARPAQRVRSRWFVASDPTLIRANGKLAQRQNPVARHAAPLFRVVAHSLLSGCVKYAPPRYLAAGARETDWTFIGNWEQGPERR